MRRHTLILNFSHVYYIRKFRSKRNTKMFKPRLAFLFIKQNNPTLQTQLVRTLKCNVKVSPQSRPTL